MSAAPHNISPASFVYSFRWRTCSCGTSSIDIYSLTEFTPAQAVAPAFLDRYVEALERTAPLMEFLTKALSLRW